VITNRIDLSYIMINKTKRCSDIISKKEKQKSELIGGSENRDENNILLISENDSDAILECSDMSDNDTELDGNATSYLTQLTCLKYNFVKVISDVPTFEGSDEQCYTLKTGDRVMVPIDQAKILFNRGMVVLVDNFVRVKNNS